MMRGRNGWWSCVGGRYCAGVCSCHCVGAGEAGSPWTDEHGGPSRCAAGPSCATRTGPLSPDTEVTGDQRRERCGVRVDDGCARRITHSGPFRLVKYDVTLASAGGLTTFRRRGVDIAMDGKVTLDITLDAASAAEAAEFERQELLEKIATLETAHGRPGNEHGAVRAGDARSTRRSLRRSATGRRARRTGAGGQERSDVSARAHLPPSDDQREDRRCARGCRRPTA